MTADPSAALAAIRAREQAATPGPWSHHEFGSYADHEPTSIVVMQGNDPDWWTAANEGEYVARLWWDSQPGADAAFIAHARDDVRRMADALAAVLALHQPDRRMSVDRRCVGCSNDVSFTVYPCPTVAAITDALGGAE